VLVLVGAAALILGVVSHGTTTKGDRRAAASLVALETAVRTRAVNWVTSQVGRDIVIACDAVTCADLAQHGFPAGNLNVLQPTAPDPYGSQLVIATAGVRSQFGSKLADVFAPEVLASFGTGTTRIDVRVIAPDGTAAFRTALEADLHARTASGLQLLANKKIAVSPAARRALRTGQVDERLLTTLAFIVESEPIRIVSFGRPAPGASSGVPLRTTDLAETDPASHRSGPAYVRQLVAALRRQVAPYLPTSIQVVELAGGESVLQVEFAAPSPLGLLHS
jgi:hypothetical protein